jgi:hypothetical protein
MSGGLVQFEQNYSMDLRRRGSQSSQIDGGLRNRRAGSQRVADETARIMEYQRAWQANRDGFAPVVIAQ